MHYEIKKIDLLSTAKFAAIFYGLIGCVPMIFGLIAFLTQAYNNGFSFQMLFVLLFPLGLAVGGFAVGIVFAFIYNIAAVHIGGIKMEIEYKEK